MKAIPLADFTMFVVDEGTGPSPPLLFVHGFPLHSGMWEHQVAHFAQHRRVIVPDLRGFGRSRCEGSPLSMPQHAADLVALLDQLNLREPVVLCGLSMGGYVSWPMVLQAPQRVAGLIVCDTLATADAPETAAHRLATAARLEQEHDHAFLIAAMLPRLFGEELAGSAAPCVAATRAMMESTSPATCAAAQRGMAMREDYTARLGAIGCPTLVLCGEHDRIATPAAMRAIAAAIPGADYIEIAGASHMAPLEMPTEVNREIELFLARHQL
jgi:pimeloyl-ACP methyl ester carboxylesterase